MKPTKTYFGTKRVKALPMTRGAYNEFRGWTIPADENPADEGYLVEYSNDGYISWSPKAAFDSAYQPIDAMSFGHAQAAMAAGVRVARAGWNGKDMWICLGKGHARQPVEAFWNKHTRDFVHQNGGFAEVLPYYLMKTADGKILMGWLASQTDLMANDWQVVAE